VNSFHVGDKIRFRTDTKGRDILTIEAVSPYVPMVKVDGAWAVLDNVVLVASAPPPDHIDEQLRFLGM